MKLAYEPPAVIEYGSWETLTKDENVTGVLGFGKCNDLEGSGPAMALCAD